MVDVVSASKKSMPSWQFLLVGLFLILVAAFLLISAFVQPTQIFACTGPYYGPGNDATGNPTFFYECYEDQIAQGTRYIRWHPTGQPAPSFPMPASYELMMANFCQYYSEHISETPNAIANRNIFISRDSPIVMANILHVLESMAGEVKAGQEVIVLAVSDPRWMPDGSREEHYLMMWGDDCAYIPQSAVDVLYPITTRAP